MNTAYDRYKNTELWNVISEAIDELIENDDLKERTTHDHIVGYLCQKVSSSLMEKGEMSSGNRTRRKSKDDG